MTPHDLKNSVWQLAVQGKLVDQRSEEGTSAELFQQIQAEKQALIKAGKIKKEKPMPEITEDEKPFDLPDGWCWARLATICSLITDGTHKTPSYTTNGVRFLSVKDISGGYFDLSNTKFISENEHAQLTQRCKPEKGDVLICRIGTLGKALAIDIDLDFSIFVSLGLIKPINKELAKYIETVINSGYGFSWIQKVKVGGGTHTFKINLDDLRMFPIPLPPLAEQKRIVAKLDEILPLIDRYEAAWNKLEEFNRHFPGDMQKSILQFAVQGRLVAQRSEEGTGEGLFQKLQAEKQALIKADKIKKEKPFPKIAEDEIPFDIPDTWKWVRLNELVSVLGDGIHGTPIFDEAGNYYFVNGNNLVKGSIVFKADTKKVSASEYEKHKKPLDENTILISINGTIGNYAFYSNEPIILGKSACYFSVLTGVNKDYIRHLINTKWFMDYAVKEATQTTIKNVSLKAMRMFPVPLPPLAEQKRIVAKLEEILPLCDRLK